MIDDHNNDHDNDQDDNDKRLITQVTRHQEPSPMMMLITNYDHDD